MSRPGRGDAGPGLAGADAFEALGDQSAIVVVEFDDIGDGADVLINPEIVESSGEWVYEEGCLSIPGLYVEMIRPKEVLLKGINLDGEEITVEADELLSRLFQHELDHLNGVLMFDRMTPEQRVEAMAEYRRLHEGEEKASKPAEPRVIKLK